MSDIQGDYRKIANKFGHYSDHRGMLAGMVIELADRIEALESSETKFRQEAMVVGQQKGALEAGVHALIDNAYLPSAMGCGNPTNGWTYPKGKYVLADELQALLEKEDG